MAKILEMSAAVSVQSPAQMGNKKPETKQTKTEKK